MAPSLATRCEEKFPDVALVTAASSGEDSRPSFPLLLRIILLRFPLPASLFRREDQLLDCAIWHPHTRPRHFSSYWDDVSVLERKRLHQPDSEHGLRNGAHICSDLAAGMTIRT